VLADGRWPRRWCTVLGARLADRPEREWVGLLAGVTFAAVPATSRYGQEGPAVAVPDRRGGARHAAVHPGTRAARPAYRRAVRAGRHAGRRLPPGRAAAAWPGTRRRTPRPRAAGRWALTALGGVLPVLPLAWLGYRQAGQVSWIPRVQVGTLLGTPDILFGAGAVAGMLIALAALAAVPTAGGHGCWPAGRWYRWPRCT